jgi:hypothetical protein
MKLVVAFLLVCFFALADNYNGCEASLFFGNGMRYEDEDAKRSKDNLKKKLLRYDQKLHDRLKFDIAYNHKEFLMIELLRVFSQWADQFRLNWLTSEEGYNFHQIMGYIDTDNTPPQDIWSQSESDWFVFRDRIRAKIAEFAKERYDTDPDLREHISRYKESIAENAGIVSFSHSFLYRRVLIFCNTVNIFSHS